MAAAMIIGTPGVVAAVPPPPPNPTDSDIQRATDVVGSQIGEVSALINQVSSADQRLQDLLMQVAFKREEANKALVDLQVARGAAERAAQAVGTAKQQLADAGEVINTAQSQFNKFVSASYQQGSRVGTLSAFVSTGGPDDALTRARLMKIVADAHSASMDKLQLARTEQANKDSAARAAKQEADTAEANASAAEAESQQAISAAVSEQDQQAAAKAQIEAEKAGAEAQLEAARNNVDGLQSQREVFDNWDRQRLAEEAAARAAEAAAKEAAAAAARRAAENKASQDAANKVQSQQQSGNVTGNVTGPITSASGNEKIEIVIDRAMSQLGVRYSWGGGNPNGPTMGVRDGGVADSYGDYKSVGFDCSGLMQYAFAGAGISIPKYSGYQYTAGKQVPSSQAKRGDMLFWGNGGVHHVALYLGDGQMIEAPFSGNVVRVTSVRYNDMTPYAVRMIG
ncbi:NlpC/P60 family protein [Tomitella biformata]|uniref:NlpC/P60 family protein n=1 Tax=Tomitella biformata TaxID=630403 RepID=UPI0004678B6C|nr:NlpC/P60 family protein [Tomitella biformata]